MGVGRRVDIHRSVHLTVLGYFELRRPAAFASSSVRKIETFSGLGWRAGQDGKQ